MALPSMCLLFYLVLHIVFLCHIFNIIIFYERRVINIYSKLYCICIQKVGISNKINQSINQSIIQVMIC